MLALAIALAVLILFVAITYGRAIVYAYSDEYKLDQRIKGITKQ